MTNRNLPKLLTGDIWTKINKLTRNNKEEKLAAIAYVTSTALDLKKGDSLVCNASDYFIRNGQTSANALKYFFDRRVRIFTNNSIHTKLLLTKSLFVVGSSNLSNNSAEYLTEAAIVTNDDTLISQAQSFMSNLIDDSDELVKKDITRLFKIPVSKRIDFIPQKSKVRKKQFGNSYWIISISDLSERIQEKERKYVEDANKTLVKKFHKKKEYEYIRCTGKLKFKTNAIEGDQFISISRDKNSSLFDGFFTILFVQKHRNWTRFYYDDTKGLDPEISLKKFYQLTHDFNFTRAIKKNSTRELSRNEANQLKNIFK